MASPGVRAEASGRRCLAGRSTNETGLCLRLDLASPLLAIAVKLRRGGGESGENGAW